MNEKNLVQINWVLFFSLAFFLWILQFSVFSYLEIQGISPDFFLILMTYMALFANPLQALFANWILGVIQDFASCEFFGFFSILYIFNSLVIIKVKEDVEADNIFISLLFVFLICLESHLIHSFVIFFLYGANCILFSLICSFYTLPFAFFVLIFFFRKNMVVYA